MTTHHRSNRSELIGKKTHWQISDLGVIQQDHQYDPELLEVICQKAVAIKEEVSAKRHLNLRYIRQAHVHIPEILELVYYPGRLDLLSTLAETTLEPYPLSVIASTITFMGATPDDGAIDWHADGVPVTEIIPLEIHDLTGGALQIYRGDYEVGLNKVHSGDTLADLVSIPHRIGASTLAQLMRVLHRTEPITTGHRISLNLNLRSRDKPYIDDNAAYYLAADNPDYKWVDQYLDDVRARQVPAYLAFQRHGSLHRAM
ncbi:hypothetical protein ABTX61_09340 [Amycolatopsis japonica]|uniref:hypothetical protein n=1 Tax=Amycolatopsis japonica TaxID=208439 RepID=UPI003328ECD0